MSERFGGCSRLVRRPLPRKQLVRRFALLSILAQVLPPGIIGPTLAGDLNVRLGDGLELRPYILDQLDMAGLSQSRSAGQAAGFNARRLRQGVRLDLAGQAEIGVIWDFGHAPGDVQRLFEAQVTYSGLRPFAVKAGVFKPSFGLESMQGAGDTLFLERASIATVTRDIAAGTGREAVQLRSSGDRYHAAVALTAGTSGPGRDGDQRAVVARLAGLPVTSDGLVVHAGASGTWVFRPPRAASTLPSL